MKFLPLLLAPLTFLAAEETEPAKPPLESLELPGLRVNLEEKSVDVTSSVCLSEGSLEFIACTKDTKEHESIIVVAAKPSHIHTALLLLGAKPGHPAIRKLVGEEGNERLIDLPPEGSKISASLVIPGPDGGSVERPISDFIAKIDYEADEVVTGTEEIAERFKTFVFAGSHLYGKEGEPKVYLADRSGSAISISTFGDELLCLPGVFAKDNHALQWALNPEHLPKPGTEVILRLRPQDTPGKPKSTGKSKEKVDQSPGTGS